MMVMGMVLAVCLELTVMIMMCRRILTVQRLLLLPQVEAEEEAEEAQAS